ncbi:tail fiber [Corynebacterium phage PSonyx]|nr:tail fiber [Corynebacterium phage PSonyx]
MLVDGQATLNNVPPGPIKVSFHVGGIADNRQRRGTVPDTGTFDIFAILKNDLTYTPEVVSATVSAKQDAVRAAGNAKTSEESAEGYAEAAGTLANAASGYAQEAKGYRDTASTHAQTATDQAGVATTKASEANTSANTAANLASAADTARQGAVTAQGLAETAADEANQKAQAIFDNYHATRARIIWVWEGTGNPLLSDFPHAKPKDYIQRKDPVTGNTTGEWRIDP